MDYKLSDKTSLNKLNIEITQSIFSNHNGMKADINNRKQAGKFRLMWKIKISYLTISQNPTGNFKTALE